MDVWGEKKNSSNSQDKYEICFADMYLEKFLVGFTVFRVFWGISRDSWKYLNFTGQRPREISEALPLISTPTFQKKIVDKPSSLPLFIIH